MDLETLRVEVSELAFGYLKAGQMSREWLGEQLAPEDLPDRFHHYDRLVDLHVTLHPQVASFAQGVQPMLREIKTETRRENHRSRDEIEGHINWPLTHQQRNNEAPGDRSLFVTERRTEAYDIPENLVLKKLLAIVYETVSPLENVTYDWVEDRWPTDAAESSSIADFKSLYQRNVHLNRITTPPDRLLTDRMIQRTMAARQEMYNRAGRFLAWRNQLLEGDQQALQTIFDSAIIEPSGDQLFELYVVLCLLKSLEQRFDELCQIRPLTVGATELAEIGDPPCFLYHDRSAARRGLRFPTTMPRAPEPADRDYQNRRHDDEWVARAEAIGYWFETIRTQLWSSNRSGRPDALVFQPALQESTKGAGTLLAVEVKFSVTQTKIDEGIVELLRYIAYATKKNSQQEFVFPDNKSDDAFGRHVHGLLVIDDSATLDDVNIEGPIDIVQASCLTQRLPEILDDVFTPSNDERCQ